MLSGFYTAASGMLMQQRTLNVIANNMANENTPGFKTERVVSTTFEHELLTRIEGNSRTPIGSGSPIRIVEDVPTTFDPSLLEATGRPFDLAINGDGFYNIQVGEEQLMTRNGNFDIDDEGFLILRGAGRVLGAKGEIEVENSSFTVDVDGTVFNSKGRRVDTLLITLPDQNSQLEKVRNGLYTVQPRPGENGEPADEAQEAGVDTVRMPHIIQGQLEHSNIDFNREMTLMMETQRTFQSCSNALKTIDQMNQKTANQIASL